MLYIDKECFIKINTFGKKKREKMQRILYVGELGYKRRKIDGEKKIHISDGSCAWQILCESPHFFTSKIIFNIL